MNFLVDEIFSCTEKKDRKYFKNELENEIIKLFSNNYKDFRLAFKKYMKYKFKLEYFKKMYKLSKNSKFFCDHEKKKYYFNHLKFRCLVEDLDMKLRELTLDSVIFMDFNNREIM
jgi:hypothetical protein